MTVSIPEPVVAAPTPTPLPVASPVPRLAPALIGRPGSAQTVYVPCPEFCTDNHSVDRQVAVEDITHGSDMFSVSVPTMAAPDTDHYMLFARVSSDPASEDPRMRAAHVLVGDCSAEDAYLTPGMTDEAAADLIAFAMRMKDLARTARAAHLPAA